MKSFTIILFFLSLVACNGKTSQQDPHVSTLGATDGILCSSFISSEINTLKNLCSPNATTNRASITTCIEKSEYIKEKFPELNCKLHNDKNTTTIIDINFVISLQNNYTKERYLNFTNGDNCGVFFVEDLYDVIERSCKKLNLKAKSEISICLNKVDALYLKYPNFNCKVISENEEYIYNVESIDNYINEIMSNL